MWHMLHLGVQGLHAAHHASAQHERHDVRRTDEYASDLLPHVRSPLRSLLLLKIGYTKA